MVDHLIKAITTDGAFRMLAVDASGVVSEAQQRHDTWPAATAALGRTLIGTLLLSSALLKAPEKLTVRIQGGGPVGMIIADGNALGEVKGYLSQPQVNLPATPLGKIDVRRAVGTNGLLSVTKDLGMKEPFTGQVPLVSGEIAEDFTYYLAKSEQIPSAMGLSVFVNQDASVQVAGGFLIQTLPTATEAQLTELEQRLQALPLVSDLLRQGQTPTQLLQQIFGPGTIKVLSNSPVRFKCDCSKDRFRRALATLSQDELTAMITEDHGAEAVCKFCGEKYQFSEVELQQLLANKS
ncbi:Hsp33 family molecular chaperone HslO [Lapidilactobacillus luobeiensis]|uniref:Hsp33 family molecular chaperone HslO n=1 Tax=Lapidilactobacillus luobeiensis TaxID=2950371 RepID=UPI0021C44E83|nr:Hsp33 family molecular chaperone HslO [Lapidilactobacillus luobeiensis]